MTVDERVEERLDPAVACDVRRIWQAYSVSELGSAVGNGALPLVAVLVLHASALQVAVLSALGGLAAAVLVLPLGTWLEFRRKRPVMVGADLVRFVALASVPLAAWLGVLGFVQLVLVAMVSTASTVMFTAASGAHLKALVPVSHRLRITSRLETTLWTSITVGPPLGGVLVAAVGATASMAVDAVSFLVSAFRLRGLRTVEADPPRRTARPERWRDTVAGFRYLAAHRGLRALWFNSLLFGGGVMLGGPLLPVLMLRDLGLGAWSYGLAIGVAGIGGVLGSLCARKFAGRLGERGVLLTFGVVRSVWPLALPFAPAGLAGFVVVAGAELLLMFCAGVFNPTFAAYRMRETDDDHLARVLSGWSISQRVAQPVGMLIGGGVAALAGTRAALLVGGVIVLVSAVALPWRDRSRAA